VLARLSASEYVRMFPQLEKVPLTFGQTIYEAKSKIDYVYFPEAGVLSIVGITGADKPIEVGIVGSEGLAGLPLFLGVPRSANVVIVQAEGTASRLKAKYAQAEFARGGSFRDAVLLFAHELFLQVSHITSCNRHHEVEERLSRWLLMMRDRVPGDRLQLTQEFLSWMLGVRNQAVSRAASVLQQREAIKYSRGVITIIDRIKLEDAACACYRHMKSPSNGHRSASILGKVAPTMIAIDACVQTTKG
jgi:CRP-like cAMP-binding protein